MIPRSAGSGHPFVVWFRSLPRSRTIGLLALALLLAGGAGYGIFSALRPSPALEAGAPSRASQASGTARTGTTETGVTETGAAGSGDAGTSGAAAPPSPSPAEPLPPHEPLVLVLDQWVGWKPFLDANGGLETRPGSIYHRLGLRLRIRFLNNYEAAADELIAGKVTVAGFSLSRLALMGERFARADAPVVVPFLGNRSAGGDGLIARKDIRSIEDLRGKKIAATPMSEGQAMLYWLLNYSSLHSADVEDIIDNFIASSSPDKAAESVASGVADAAATWQPHLAGADLPGSGMHTLVSTKDLGNLILNALVLREDVYEAAKPLIAALARGALEAGPLYAANTDSVRLMPIYADMTDAEALEMLADAAPMDYARNRRLLGPDKFSQELFRDMLDIWEQVEAGGDEEGDPAEAPDAAPRPVPVRFDAALIDSLAGCFAGGAGKAVPPAEVPSAVPPAGNAAASAVNATAVSSGSAIAVPAGNATATLSKNAAASPATESKAEAPLAQPALFIWRMDLPLMDDGMPDPGDPRTRALISMAAHILAAADGLVAQVEGNTSAEGPKDFNQLLSLERAKAVAALLTAAGAEPGRLFPVGNGPDLPLSGNTTPEGRARNQRTDLVFKRK